MVFQTVSNIGKSPNQALEWMAGSGRRRYAALSLVAATQLGRSIKERTVQWLRC